ncbi:Serine hydrolase-like protein [Eumeta japonica]|uniref:Serine hydrolase-like protein n=1 Tax=Eumeta variegata TaxID=151549 RepID=A0A4C1VBI2_EUMVA|nr:Serine hydrolase-like protein [Eumeta japonica]
MKKIMEERYFKAPWGKVAMVSWGKPSGVPVLLVHGHMDTAATFIPLLEYLPDNYYYVGLDLPGHGKSDYFPAGVMPNQLHFIETLQLAIEHLRWERFIYISHSMGAILGIYFNAVYPGQISKIVNLDPGPPIYWFAFSKNLSMWFEALYNNYYENLNRITNENPKLHTHESAKRAVIRNRNLTEKQAEIILSRSIIPVDEEKIRLSWDVKMKHIGQPPLSKDFLFILMTNNSPPTLNLMAQGQEYVVSWGNEKGQPVLLVHGRQDSAATFLPLLEFLPRSHYYVALDFPGHGNSTPFPVGVALTRIHFVAALKEVVDHLQWRNFVYIAHSMGSEMGMLYNVLHPGRISKFILLDPVLAFQRLQLRNFPDFFELFYSNYYDNYDEHNNNNKVYKKEEAIKAVQKARGLNKYQAELVLSRNLQPVGNHIYRYIYRWFALLI